jgi:hypothetical protein
MLGCGIDDILNMPHSAYKSMRLSQLGLSKPTTKKNKGALKKWKDEEWLNLNALMRGIISPCGKKVKEQGNEPTVCRPRYDKSDKTHKTPRPLAESLTNTQIKKAIKEKEMGKRINWKDMIVKGGYGGSHDNNYYLYVSPNPKYKYRVEHNNKNIDFGANGYSDYILSKGDNVKKKAYIARHKVREDWSDLSKKGTWSRFILWNKKSLNGSIKDMEKRFDIKIILE